MTLDQLTALCAVARNDEVQEVLWQAPDGTTHPATAVVVGAIRDDGGNLLREGRLIFKMKDTVHANS